MNSVKPLLSAEEINRFRESLKRVHEKYRILFELGLETGYRISDLLRTRPLDVLEGDLRHVEEKTGKSRAAPLSLSLRGRIASYKAIYNLSDVDYLIFSTSTHKDKPLSREQVYRTFKRCSRLAGLSRIGTHTMRKTYAVYNFRLDKDLEGLRDKMNHSSSTVTAMYVIEGVFDKDTI